MTKPLLLARWCLIVAAMVFVMVVVGGIPRLTEPGLSMVRWEPISGIIPPLSDEQWAAEFRAYQATPEYLKVNAGMTLAAFKSIFFWEYLHRVLGRLIGLAMIVPLAWFAWKRAFPKGYGARFAALAALVVLQGAIGWWMVASGLVDRPDVSHIRLAVHLLTALFFFSCLIWTELDLIALAANPDARSARLNGFTATVVAILAIQLLFGAFTAGLDAGKTANSWPLMYGSILPDGSWDPNAGVLENITGNPLIVQFIHRWWGWIAAAAALLIARRARNIWPLAPFVIGVLVVTQILLGIATLMTVVAIPVAAAHQAVAVLLLAYVVRCAHHLGSRA